MYARSSSRSRRRRWGRGPAPRPPPSTPTPRARPTRRRVRHVGRGPLTQPVDRMAGRPAVGEHRVEQGYRTFGQRDRQRLEVAPRPYPALSRPSTICRLTGLTPRTATPCKPLTCTDCNSTPGDGCQDRRPFCRRATRGEPGHSCNRRNVGVCGLAVFCRATTPRSRTAGGCPYDQ